MENVRVSSRSNLEKSLLSDFAAELELEDDEDAAWHLVVAEKYRVEGGEEPEATSIRRLDVEAIGASRTASGALDRYCLSTARDDEPLETSDRHVLDLEHADRIMTPQGSAVVQVRNVSG